MEPDDRLPEDFSFDDFTAALDRIDAPEDIDLPTDWDGCVLLASMPVTEIAAVVAKLQRAGVQAHAELPESEEVGGGGAGSVFVPFAELARSRALLRLQS